LLFLLPLFRIKEREMEWDIRYWVHRAMEEVTSADRAYRWLREQGFEWTRAEVREAWREVGMKEYWSTVIETWGTDRYVPRAWQMEGSSKQRAEYQYLVEYQYYDEEGNLQTRYISTLSDKPLTFSEVFAEVSDTAEEYTLASGGLLIHIGVGGVIRRGK
jgi:hypothetical protein